MMFFIPAAVFLGLLAQATALGHVKKNLATTTMLRQSGSANGEISKFMKLVQENGSDLAKHLEADEKKRSLGEIDDANAAALQKSLQDLLKAKGDEAAMIHVEDALHHLESLNKVKDVDELRRRLSQGTLMTPAMMKDTIASMNSALENKDTEGFLSHTTTLREHAKTLFAMIHSLSEGSDEERDLIERHVSTMDINDADGTLEALMEEFITILGALMMNDGEVSDASLIVTDRDPYAGPFGNLMYPPCFVWGLLYPLLASLQFFQCLSAVKNVPLIPVPPPDGGEGLAPAGTGSDVTIQTCINFKKLLLLPPVYLLAYTTFCGGFGGRGGRRIPLPDVPGDLPDVPGF